MNESDLFQCYLCSQSDIQLSARSHARSLACILELISTEKIDDSSLRTLRDLGEILSEALDDMENLLTAVEVERGIHEATDKTSFFLKKMKLHLQTDKA